MINKNHPDAIFIQLHTYCNANCINCPHDFTYKTIHPKGKMSESTWKKILHDLIEMDFRGQIGFYLHHEPLIDVSLFDKINDINHMTNSFVVLSTNGALLNQKNIEKLIISSPKKVHINLNSGVKEEFENSMGLNFETTISNVHDFISQAKDLIEIEINCPVLKGFNVQSLKELFPTVQVNLEFYANSRGGLIPELFSNVEGSRFKLDSYCRQPSQNLNILFDGSVIVCCMDWMHESKNERLNINNTSIVEIYNEVKKLEDSFRIGDYSKYKMCQLCSSEMGFNKNDKGEKLKILLTNHHLLDYTGSEVYTLTLAKQLKMFGINVTVYSPFIGNKIVEEFGKLNVTVFSNIEELRNYKFDLAHVHHNITAVEVRHIFPELPILFLSHGVLPFLEQPPIVNLNISRYLAISEEVEKKLKEKIADERLVVHQFTNTVDEKLFFSRLPINETPQSILVISGRIDKDREDIIKQACNKLGLNYRFVGGRFGTIKPEDLPTLINQADIVFSLGRGAIEAMMCGRVPFIFDYLGGDGLVTPENFYEIRKNNFSGRRYSKNFSVDELIHEIKKYKASYGESLLELAHKYYSAELWTKKLIEHYLEIKETQVIPLNDFDNKLVDFYYQSTKESRQYAYHMGQLSNGNIDNSENRLEIKDIINKVEELIELGNLSEAKSILHGLLNNYQDNIEVLNDLAVVEILQNQYSEAEDLLCTVLKLEPQNEVALGNLKYLQQIKQEEIINANNIG